LQKATVADTNYGGQINLLAGQSHMNYFFLEPEVAGELGKATVLDTTTHPPLVSKLYYQFSGWLGDVLLESFPCFIICADTASRLEKDSYTGLRFSEVETSTTPEFDAMFPGRVLPKFRWLQVQGVAGSDDFGLASDHRLVVSEKALEKLRKFGIGHALVEDFHTQKKPALSDFFVPKSDSPER